MTDSVLSRPGAELAYRIIGDGPSLGYSHGLLLSRAAEDSLGLLNLDRLGRQRKLLRYDARAHGRSTGRREPQDYLWSNLADDLLAMTDLIAAEPGGHEGRPVDWGGGSMGTGTLLWAATRRPEKFRRLVLTIPPTTGPSRAGAIEMYRRWADTIEAKGKADWAAGLAQFGKPPIFEQVESFRIDADISEELLPSVLRGAAMSDLPPAAALAALPHPALILAWDTDPGHPVSSAEYLADTLPDTRLHIAKSADDIGTWTGRVEEFLGD
jgi:pimeloyl-ACP methyl ester carboxylesterase